MQLALPIFENTNKNIEYNSIHRNHATFKAGLGKVVHNWFRLTPSFGPNLVKIILDEFKFDKASVVLDPFAGAGTTLIECKLLGLKSYGFEINPFLYFAGKTSLNWSLSTDALEKLASEIDALFRKKQIVFKDSKCEDLPYKMPTIHNVYKWWRADVLKDLLLLKASIQDATNGLYEEYRNFFFLCLAGVLVPDLTNVTLGRLQLYFIDRSKDEINVYKTFSTHMARMLKDYKQVTCLDDLNAANIFHVDSTELNEIALDDKVNLVITSPPYPNRYSYVWNTRPFLYFFDFFSKAEEASNLDKKSIGGTWGTATSILAKGILEPINNAVKDQVAPLTNEIRENDNLMANYVMKYFNQLTKQIIVMDRLLTPQAKIAYVVGNSRIKDVYIETDWILSRILSDLDLGYKKTRINRFRRRNSGEKLFESIVYAEK
jgi:hypothetical protein